MIPFTYIMAMFVLPIVFIFVFLEILSIFKPSHPVILIYNKKRKVLFPIYLIFLIIMYLWILLNWIGL